MSFVKAGIAIGATLSAGVLGVAIVRMQEPPEPAPVVQIVESLRPEPVKVTPIVEPEDSEVVVLPAIEIVAAPRVPRAKLATVATKPVELCPAPWRELDSGPEARRARSLVPCDRLASDQRLLHPSRR